ncbi:LysR family transcriptional regulator [Roseomonas sp. PWR1]|uniref:LysR family transcriptional regulator n=1 Tax=Roseomonas nitratireducens TaxID=2820810 RepID=A0ABS4AZ45_9PROT|nr:LysR family transcriptional regulator [Neoroseomonas nitratireducens]
MTRRPTDLDTALLRCFLLLAETRSFTRTGERLGRTQPAVTLQLRRLEEAVGRRLLLRDRRRVALTAEGEALLPVAREILGLLDAAAARLSDADAAGEVRFGSPEDFATAFLPAILARFVQSHPAVRLSTACELTRRLVEGIEAGAYDLVVIKQAPGRLHPGARAVWREALVWVGAEGARPPGREGPLRLVLSPAPCVYRERAEQALAAAGRDFEVVYTSPSLAGAAAAVRAGLGVTVLPRTLVPPGLAPISPRAGLPPLEETVICLLLREGAPGAAEALARAVEQGLARAAGLS